MLATISAQSRHFNINATLAYNYKQKKTIQYGNQINIIPYSHETSTECVNICDKA